MKRKEIVRIINFGICFIAGLVFGKGFILLGIGIFLFAMWSLYLLHFKKVWDNNNKSILHIIKKDIFLMYNCGCDYCFKMEAENDKR